MANSNALESAENPLKNLIHSNYYIHELVERNIEEFLRLRDEVLSKPEIEGLTTFNDILSPVIKGLRVEPLKACTRSTKIQLALCGENSSGKTAFIHTFLGIGKILRSGDGPVTARITKLTYALAEQASVRLYKTLRDQTLIEEEVSLSPFFTKEKPDWMGVSCALEKYTKRPEGMNENSAEFDQWARCLVEIRIPSPTLSLGIDVYDTPGFLFNDAPVLKEILHDLVEVIHPTIVFLYANPSTDDGARGCFVAMKAALHDIESTSIFFLNSKADIQHMPKFRKGMSEEEFLQILTEERTQRYDLLLKAPFLGNATLEGLPSSIDQCHCFDLCSVNSQSIKPWGPLMNRMTIERIIRFVANDDLTITTRVCRLVIPIIDAFFQFLHLTNNRTAEQLLQLKYDAMNWKKRYFEFYTAHTENFLTKLFAEVTCHLEKEENAVIKGLLANAQPSKSLASYLSEAINLQLIRPAIRKTIKGSMNEILESIRLNVDLNYNSIANEILVGALGQQEISDFAAMLLGTGNNVPSISTSILYMVNTIATPMITCAKTLESSTDAIVASFFQTSEDPPTTNRNPNNTRLQDSVHPLMLMIKEKIGEQHMAMMRRAVELAGQLQNLFLESLIDRNYKEVSPELILQQETLNRVGIHASRFIVIECELSAAQDMARFPGHIPELRAEQCRSTLFSTFLAAWGSEENLMVKKQSRSLPHEPNIAYYEAHHHRQVAKLGHPYILNLKYLYNHRLDDQTSELWMIFPNVLFNLEQFIQNNPTSISLEQVLIWMKRITGALSVLHYNDLIHRNVVLRNIGIDEQGGAYLMDLGNWNPDEGDLSMRHYPSFTANGIDDDVVALGYVGRLLYASVNGSEKNSLIMFEFDELMNECIQSSPEKPVPLESVQEKLTTFISRLS